MQATKRYAYIDVLRGLAALMVVYQHTAEVTANYATTHMNGVEQSIIGFFTQVIGIGELGVCIFLMISGFVVPFSLLKYTSNPLRHFAAHRFFRLYPAYWLSIPLGVIFVVWRLGTQYGGHDVNWMTVLTNFSMLQTFFGVDDVMGQYWTLALELVFYVLCATLFYFRRLDSFKSMMGLLILIFLTREASRHLLAAGSHAFGVLTMFRYLDFMFFGILYRRWLLDGNRKAGSQAIWMLLFTFLCFGAISNIRSFAGGDYFALKTQLTHLVAIAIFVLCTKLVQPSNRIGTFLGKISYSIYLFHPVIFYPLFAFWFQSSPLARYPHLFIFLSAGLTILISSITYYLIEKPFIAMGNRIFGGGKLTKLTQMAA